MRASSPELDVLLRRALADHVVEGAEPMTTYSVRLSEDRVHFLYWGGCTAVRTRDPRRLLTGLLAHLGGHEPPSADVVRVRALALVRGGKAVVVPETWRSQLARFEPGLHRAGIAAHDGPWADVDAGSQELVVPERLLADDGALEQAGALGPPSARGAEPIAAPGRYPVVGWVLSGHPGDDAASTAGAIMRLAPDVIRNTLVSPPSAAAALLAALPFNWADAEDLGEVVTDILSSSPVPSATTQRT